MTRGKLGRHRRCSIDKPSKSPINLSYQCRRRGANHPIIIRRITEIIRFQLRKPLESSELTRGRPNRKVIIKRCPVIVNSATFDPSRIRQSRAPIFDRKSTEENPRIDGPGRRETKRQRKVRKSRGSKSRIRSFDRRWQKSKKSASSIKEGSARANLLAVE